MIDFGAQVSGDESDTAITSIHIKLLDIFYNPPKLNGYFSTLNEFQIVFRISGDGHDFNGNGPEFLRVSNKYKAIRIDLTVPEARWKDLSKEEFKQHISKEVKKCFKLLLGKATKLNEVLELDRLNHDFINGMQEFDSWSIE